MSLSPASILVNTSGAIQQVAPATCSNLSVPFGATGTLLLAGNPNRAAMSIQNDTTNAYLIKFGTGITTSSYTFYIPAQAMYDSPYPCYTGQVWGMGWSTGSGNVYVSEMTP